MAEHITEQRKCPNCGKDIAEAAWPYCEACDLEIVTCPGCGCAVGSGEHTCPECGAEVAKPA